MTLASFQIVYGKIAYQMMHNHGRMMTKAGNTQPYANVKIEGTLRQ